MREWRCISVVVGCSSNTVCPKARLSLSSSITRGTMMFASATGLPLIASPRMKHSERPVDPLLIHTHVEQTIPNHEVDT